MTGQRREQSVTRAELHEEEHDAARNIAKFNPLTDWTEVEVWDYLKAFDVPVNPLMYQGYPSIGCATCTHPISEGDDPRAGRWRGLGKTECGLHV